MPTATRRRMAAATTRHALLLDLVAVFLLLLISGGGMGVQGFLLHPGQPVRNLHTFQRPWHCPRPPSAQFLFFTPTTYSTLSAGRTGHDHVQTRRHSRHSSVKDGGGPLKSLRQAVALLSSALQLVFSSGDVFGTYSSIPPNTRAPDLGRRRGGASSGRGSGGPRWGRRGSMRRGGVQDGGDDADEDEDEETNLIEKGDEAAAEAELGLNDRVSKRDLNSWQAWQAGSPQTQQEQERRAQRQQRRRKKMTFSTRYSCAVSVANASRLEEYMALPFDQYSLLDQSFISRVEGRENVQGNVFRFMVPANELVGLQTVPIVDVRVDLDARRRQLSINSISSRFVARAADGTILGTQAMSLLTNNSLAFSTRILWDSSASGKLQRGGSPNGKAAASSSSSSSSSATPSSTWSAAAGEWGGGAVPEGSGNGPGANLARLRKRIFFRGGNVNKAPQEQDLMLSEGDNSSGNTSVVRTDAAAGRLRKLSCRATLEVGVVVPPPFSLLPGLVLRQGASLILSTLVGTLVNRFLELLVADFYKWQDQASREASVGGLLGYDPERFDEREIEVSEADEDEDEPPLSPAPPLPEPEYII